MKILHIGPLKIPNTVPSDHSSVDVFPGLGSDGPSRSILGLASALAAEGVDVGVLNTLAFDVKHPNIMPGVRFLPPYCGFKYNPLVSADQWLEMIIENFGRPDWVNFHDIYNFFCASLGAALKKRGLKYLLSPRGGLSRFAQKRRSYKKKIANWLFAREFVREADFIHALNENEAQEISRFHPDLDIRISPNGLPKAILNRLEESHGVARNGSGEILVGFLGLILWEIKGIDLLLEAIRQYQTSEREGRLKFLLAGPVRFENERKKIDQAIQSLPYPEKVVLVGPKFENEKRAFFQSIDLFVQPSRTEGMSIVSLEAMAMAKPCLFSKGTNMDQVIERAKGGWGYDGTSEALCGKFLEISRMSREQLREMGDNARSCFESHYTWDRAVKKYLEMFRS